MAIPATTLTTLADSPINPQTALLIGIVLIIGTLFIARSRSRRRDSSVDGRAGAQARMHNSRLASQAREDIDELMIRLEELSREICGQIDTRFAKLEHAITEADAKLAALRAATGTAVTMATPQTTVPDVSLDPKHAEICRRAQSGQPNLTIAREMDMPIGEVELILSLARSRQNATGVLAPEPVAEPDEAEPPKGLRLDERA